jgi:hypothetical protein
MMRTATRLIAALLVLGAPATAQTFPIDPGARQVEARSQAEGLSEMARTADTGAGEIGQRQTREEAAPNIEPLGRINYRIENRVQSRLRNRVDRNYDATANVTAPFKRAEGRTRKTWNGGPR